MYYFRQIIITMAAACLLGCAAQDLGKDAVCGGERAKGRSLTLSVNSRRNETGDWVDTFAARTEFSNSSEATGVDVRHDVYECEGKRVVYIQGVAKGTPPGDPAKRNGDRITFHPRCGSNVEILENGRSAQKRNVDEGVHSTLFTNRPLRDNELFEVRLDKKGSKFSQSLGIGALTHNPNDVNMPYQMSISPHAWVYHNGAIYTNNIEKITTYGRNLNDLQVGDRVGVMRKDTGAIHFFVNGVDQGPAVPNLPPPVYGILELWKNTIKATIVQP